MRSGGVGLVRMMLGEEDEGRSEADMAASLVFLNWMLRFEAYIKLY